MRKDAEERFQPSNPLNAESWDATANGLRTRVRGSGRYGLLQVEQSLRTTTKEHPEYGGLMMTKSLLPAAESKLPEVVSLLERDVTSLLARRGF